MTSVSALEKSAIMEAALRAIVQRPFVAANEQYWSWKTIAWKQSAIAREALMAAGINVDGALDGDTARLGNAVAQLG